MRFAKRLLIVLCVSFVWVGNAFGQATSIDDFDVDLDISPMIQIWLSEDINLGVYLPGFDSNGTGTTVVNANYSGVYAITASDDSGLLGFHLTGLVSGAKLPFTFLWSAGSGPGCFAGLAPLPYNTTVPGQAVLSTTINALVPTACYSVDVQDADMAVAPPEAYHAVVSLRVDSM